MKFIGARELRLNPTQVWKELREEGEVVVTTNGKPRAILTNANESNWEEVLTAIRRSRTQMAISKLRCKPKQNITSDDIEKEIASVRRKLGERS